MSVELLTAQLNKWRPTPNNDPAAVQLKIRGRVTSHSTERLTKEPGNLAPFWSIILTIPGLHPVDGGEDSNSWRENISTSFIDEISVRDRKMGPYLSAIQSKASGKSLLGIMEWVKRGYGDTWRILGDFSPMAVRCLRTRGFREINGTVL